MVPCSPAPSPSVRAVTNTIAMRAPYRTPAVHPRHFALLAVASCVVSGCYDGDTLVQRVRDRSIRTRLEEIDLGTFRATLPRDEVSSEVTEIDLHLFGEMPRHKIDQVEDQLEEKAFLLHDKTLAALRELDREDLTHPDLPELREKMLLTVNGVLDEPLIEAIGIHDLRFIRH